MNKISRTYFHIQNGKRIGPLTSTDLKALADKGGIKPDDLILRDDLEKPFQAKRLKGLFASKKKSEADGLESSKRNTRVFVSHSSRDFDLAIQLVNFLESRSIDCWIAPRNIVPGKDYNGQITAGIKLSLIHI